MQTSILSVNCRKCGVRNWHCNGDMSDYTIDDVEHVLCWSCAKVFSYPGALTTPSKLGDAVGFPTPNLAAIAEGLEKTYNV